MIFFNFVCLFHFGDEGVEGFYSHVGEVFVAVFERFEAACRYRGHVILWVISFKIYVGVEVDFVEFTVPAVLEEFPDPFAWVQLTWVGGQSEQQYSVLFEKL